MNLFFQNTLTLHALKNIYILKINPLLYHVTTPFWSLITQIILSSKGQNYYTFQFNAFLPVQTEFIDWIKSQHEQQLRKNFHGGFNMNNLMQYTCKFMVHAFL